MNTVQITGNLAKDPIIRATKTGKAVASFSVGVSKKITKANGERNICNAIFRTSEI